MKKLLPLNIFLYFCRRNDKDKAIFQSDSDTIHYSLFTIFCLRPGRADHGGAGAGGDGLPHVCANGEGGKGAGGRRQHTVYGDEQRVRVSRADL